MSRPRKARTPWQQRREALEVFWFGERKISGARQLLTRDGVAELPETDQKRDDDRIARVAQRVSFVDHDRGFGAALLQAQHERGAARRRKLASELNRLAQIGRGHRGEAE